MRSTTVVTGPAQPKGAQPKDAQPKGTAGATLSVVVHHRAGRRRRRDLSGAAGCVPGRTT
jgi:hypothetical protein